MPDTTSLSARSNIKPAESWQAFAKKYTGKLDDLNKDKPVLQMANRNDNGQVLTMDMVKFADAARESFDKDGKTGLNKSEFAGLTNIFGVDEKLKSDLMFDILDRNGDNTIDTVELGALFMYMDQAKGEYGDGDITHDEMKTAIDKFFKNPADAGQFFDSAISESPLKARYKTFLEGKK